MTGTGSAFWRRWVGRVSCEKTGWTIHARKGPEKVVLAWWFRRRTTVSLRWVSERLSMGHYTRVTQAVSRTERRLGRKLNQIKRKLLRLGTGEKDKQ
jgi:hypothetical protein